MYFLIKLLLYVTFETLVMLCKFTALGANETQRARDY
jgi:hypothetical protein